jgi:hypothetical protein
MFYELGERTATEYNPFGSTAWTLNGTKTRTFIGKESDAESNLGDTSAHASTIAVYVDLPVWMRCGLFNPSTLHTTTPLMTRLTRQFSPYHALHLSTISIYDTLHL